MNVRRTLGRRLLAGAAHIAPETHREWAEAMLGEFEAIDSDSEALQWCVGSAFALLRASVMAMTRSEWQRGATMSRVFVSASVILLVVLWTATPVVRHGASLVYQVWRVDWYAKNWKEVAQRDIARVRTDARWQNDPEALAYLALNESDPETADRLITQAVEKDPKLGWAYLLLAQAHAKFLQTRAWNEKFRQFDNRNALGPLIAARELRRGSPMLSPETAPAWESQMKQAFAAPEYNDYVRERMDLQRAVMRRYQAGNPISLLAVIYRLPFYPYPDSQLYADKLILEGNRTGDLSKYREIIDFAQRLYLGASADLEQSMANDMLKRSMGILGPKLAAQGRADEAAQMAFQLAAIHKQTKSMIDSRDEHLLHAANVIHLGVLFAAISIIGVFGTTAVWVVARLRNRAVRVSGFLTGWVMVLITSLAVVYVSYGPYEQIYHNFMDGQFVPPKLIASFGPIVNAPFLIFRGTSSYSVDVLLWQLFFVGCILALVAIAARHLPVWRKSELRPPLT